ncbi:MAG: hypothetical protein K0R29_2018 [Pseudobdellovibrio sp.]|jgi:hypothetical protein|nr:hypothetical protein [Pseudobdellovibrio sp.]
MFCFTNKSFIAVLMAFLISPLPQAMAAVQLEGRPQMISTKEVMRRMSVNKDRKELSDLLLRDRVKAALEFNGVSSEEAGKRLAALSDQEVQRLSEQIKEARAGGDVLTTIVLVLLIIFLVQRI